MCPELPPRQEDLELSRLDVHEELIVFRILLSDDPETAEFADSFRSRAELGLPPRARTPEERHPLIHQGISAYESRVAAVETARRFRRLGRYVGMLRLTREVDVRFLRWGPRGHLTLWAESVRLSQCVIDTIDVDEVAS